ncbi:MAG: hypothetical protein LBE76_04225 [Nitrososphaerota archaeon]|jgi:protein tyrosine/serine phosphatase|nr:hypothetical protein [Nitrososphaerota archaeon]
MPKTRRRPKNNNNQQSTKRNKRTNRPTHTKGDPTNPLKWTSKSTRNLETASKKKLQNKRHHNYQHAKKNKTTQLQVNKKIILQSNPSHPDRNIQFEHINKTAKQCISKVQPVISIDAKKKENIGW